MERPIYIYIYINTCISHSSNPPKKRPALLPLFFDQLSWHVNRGMWASLFKSHTLDMFCPEEDRESRITGVCDLPLLRYEPPSSRRFRVGGGRKTNARWSEGCEPKWHRRAVFSSIYASMLKHTASKYLYFSLLQSSKKETSAASTLFWPT